MDLADDDGHRSISPDTIDADSEPANEKEVEEKGDNLEELCEKFINKVYLPECAAKFLFCFLSSPDERIQVKGLSLKS